MKSRIYKVKQLLKEEKLDALIIDNPIDLYYLTAQQLSLGRLLITQDEETLFVDGRYFETCEKNAPVSVILSKGLSADSTFGKMWNFSDKRIGFDSEFTTFSSYKNLEALKGEFVPLKSPLKRMRAIKEPEEIKALKTSALLCVQGYEYLLGLIKENVTEEQLSSELEIFWKRSGGEGLAFNPHIAFGPNSSQPHYHSSAHPLKRNMPILIDIGVVKQKYHSDMTRVVFYGEPGKKIEEIYKITKQAYDKALEICKPGVPIKKVDHAARSWIDNHGYGNCFTHSLGHGIGLETHEYPIINALSEEELKEGMAITIEPGIYLPGIGGVRIEDTIVITKNGYENLTSV